MEFQWQIKDLEGQGQEQFAGSEPSVDLSTESKWYGNLKENQRFGGSGTRAIRKSEPSVDLSAESKWYRIPKGNQGFWGQGQDQFAESTLNLV